MEAVALCTPKPAAPETGGNAQAASSDVAADAPAEEVTPPKELPELLVERLVTLSSCFDPTIL